MAVTSDEATARRLRSLRDHGADARDDGSVQRPAAMPDFPRIGFNYRMTDIQGAIGSVQMDRAAWILDERRRCASYYDEHLQDIDWLSRPSTPSGYVHGYQSYVCRVESKEPARQGMVELESARDGLIAHLAEAGVGSRPGTHAPALATVYRDKYAVRPEDVPQAATAEASTIALPLYAGMTRDDLEYVIDAVVRWRRSSG
jgi:dTDP-4-amino-4,6-dideoxygalactose transaminase